MADGIRTRDHRDHNPGLYQLSYRHRGADRIARPLGASWRGFVDATAPGAYPARVVERKEAVMKVICCTAFRLDAALT